MSAASAVALRTSTPIAAMEANRFAQFALRAVFYCLLFSIVFAPEFPRSGAAGFLYEKAAFGFRIVDLAIVAIAFAHLAFLVCLRGRRLSFPQPLVVSGGSFLVCIATAAAYGYSRGGSNFFFDWRGLALGMALYVVWSFWMQTAEDVEFAVRCFAVYFGLRLSLLYLLYAAGYRDTLFGASIPVFDGPILSAVVFTTLLALSAQQGAVRRSGRAMWMSLAIAGGLMILLCLRRTYWIELGIGIAILTFLRRQQGKRLAIFVAALCAIGLALGSTFLDRLESLDITRSDTAYSADNADHLNDLYDAWYQVQRSPVFGIGLGTSYETWHIRKWKPESVMVHNAPLHVWLKYGIAGLLCYLWFHFALLRWLRRQVRTGSRRQMTFVNAAFAYICSQFIATLGFAPWPYSELQMTLLMSFLLAAVVASSRSELPA